MQWLPNIPIDQLPGPEYFLGLGASLVRVVLILTAAYVVTRLMRRAAQRMRERTEAEYAKRGDGSSVELSKRMVTLMRFVKVTINVVIWSVAVIMALREVGYDIGPLIAGAGVVGLAVGFGAQNLVKDIIGGLFLLLEDQVRVGDVAKINGTGGLVEEINLRTIVLRDLEGIVHIFPNGAIETLSNLTRGFSCYVFDIGVAYKEDTDRVIELLEEVAAELAKEPEFESKVMAPLQVFGVDKFADSAVVIKARIQTLPLAQWAVGREMNRRIKKRFDQEGIEIPFPHRTLYWGESNKPGLSDGDAEAIRKIVREELASAKGADDTP